MCSPFAKITRVKNIVVFLYLCLLASCSTRLEKWASSHSLNHNAVATVAGSYDNHRIGKMRPDKGLWYILTGEDTDVDSGVTLSVHEGFLVARARIAGEQREKRLEYQDKGNYLALPTRNEIAMVDVPVVFMHGSDSIALGASDKKLFINLSSGGTIYLGILPMMSAGSPFDIYYERQPN